MTAESRRRGKTRSHYHAYQRRHKVWIQPKNHHRPNLASGFLLIRKGHPRHIEEKFITFWSRWGWFCAFTWFEICCVLQRCLIWSTRISEYLLSSESSYFGFDITAQSKLNVLLPLADKRCIHGSLVLLCFAGVVCEKLDEIISEWLTFNLRPNLYSFSSVWICRRSEILDVPSHIKGSSLQSAHIKRLENPRILMMNDLDI